MKIKKLIIIPTLLITFLANSLNATTYYVNATEGNDNNDGKSESTAWKTLSKVSNMSNSFLPGDSILFKRNETWLGERFLTADHASGTQENPIVYDAYGNGEKPIFDLITVQTLAWVNEGNNIWSAVIGEGARIFRNNIELLRDPLPDDIPLGTQGTQYYTEMINNGNNNKLYIFSETNPTNDTFKMTAHNIALQFLNTSNIHINNLDFRGGASATIRIENDTNWVINNCNIGFNAGYGITCKYSSNIKILHCNFNSNYTVDRSMLGPGGSGIDYSGNMDAIALRYGSLNVEIAYCYFKNWTHSSFCSASANATNVTRFTKFHHNELTAPDINYGGRIAYSGYSEDGEYYNNYIHDIAVANQLGGSRNHFHHNIIDGVTDSPLKTNHIGIGVWITNYNEQIKDNIIENNIIANTESKGLEIYSINFDSPGEVSGNIIRNNIIYNCGITENNINIQFHEDQAGELIYNNIVENNLIYNKNTTQTCLFQYNGILSDVNTFNTQHQDIQNNIGGNPMFVDAENGDFHLLPNSPAIDAGTTPLSTHDYDGNIIPNGNAPDIGVYEYQNPNNIIKQATNNVNIYPNPAKNILQLELNNEHINKNIIIYNVFGLVVKQLKANNKQTIINISDLQSGIYFLKVDKVIKKIIIK